MFHVLPGKYTNSYYMSHFILRHNGFLKGKISNTRKTVNYSPHYKHTLPVSLSVNVKICFLHVSYKQNTSSVSPNYIGD